ncbi:MAG: acylphosphatase [Gammaproteobacteria bacterium]|nr:acylphosphatase [Gammaproteobacteria bacterium]
MIGKRCIVSGRVQGVWYRATTRNKALELGLNGLATNLRDGRVEVIVIGPKRQVEILCAWLWDGPPMAVVESVNCENYSGKPQSGFATG